MLHGLSINSSETLFRCAIFKKENADIIDSFLKANVGYVGKFLRISYLIYGLK